MWRCDCGFKTKTKLRYPVKCKCGRVDWGNPTDTDIEFCDIPRDEIGTRDAIPRKSRGPGTELKKKLSWFAAFAGKDCKCNKHARKMDQMGCDWCEANLETIVEWLRDAHSHMPLPMRVIPFVPEIVRGKIREAIDMARATF